MFNNKFSDCNKIMKKSVIFLKIRKIALVSTKANFDQNIFFPFNSNVEETKIWHAEVVSTGDIIENFCFAERSRVISLINLKYYYISHGVSITWILKICLLSRLAKHKYNIIYVYVNLHQAEDNLFVSLYDIWLYPI